MFLVCVVLGVPAGIVGIPLTLITRDISLLYKWGNGIAALGVRAAGIRLDIQGYEHIPAGRACIFMCNHVSNLDPPILLPKIPGRASVMLKASLMKIPLLGPAMRLGKYVPVERESRASAIKSLRFATEVLKEGIHMVVFAEGTRSRTGRLLPFKKGPFHLAENTKVPVIPTVIYGTGTMLVKGSWGIRPGTAHVRFLDPIDPAQYSERDALMHAVRESMIAALPVAMRPEEE
ncbi:MAG: 1-acyl-sn-glycerol-3-phosphate acyltransferase [Acidobacteria bacterium]|nr:1-acyl-sn-glycerol-3-phosphate acyltransferase [Acidobacteriota bacterium]